MEKEKIIITVSGRGRTSRLAYMLNKFLKENDFDVEQEITKDYWDENHYKRLMSKNLDETIDKLKNERMILIKQEQLSYKYFN